MSAFPPAPSIVAALFLSGMLAAELERARRPDRPRARASVVACAGAGTTVMFRNVYTPGPVVCLASPSSWSCAAAVSPASSPRDRRDASATSANPIYLLHGFPVFAILHGHAVGRWYASSALGFGCIGLVAITAIVSLATAIHVPVERPGIALGRRVMRPSPVRAGEPVHARLAL